MTQHVSEAYKRHRRGTWIGVLGVLAAVTAVGLMIVLPAFAAAGDRIPPPSGAGVTPTELGVGGSNFSCATHTGGTPAGMSQFQISKPTAGSYTDPATGVTFVLTNEKSGKDRQKFFSFSVAGADVFHVGVNGGTNTAWYAYPSIGVVSDTNLHATLDNKGTLYTASITTFCFIPRVTTISGQVYLDKDGLGTFDGTDLPLGGWSVSLHRTSAPAGQVGSAVTTGANGTYLFTDVPVGASYRVCASAPSGTWGQVKPTGNTECQAVAAGTPAGVIIATLTGPQTSPATDFANQSLVTLPETACESPFDGPSFTDGLTYSAQLVAIEGEDGGCKTGDVVMYTYKDGQEFVAALNPTTSGTGIEYKVVEHIHWEFDGPDADNQNLATMRYDDTFPYDGVEDGNTTEIEGLREMPLCLSDPRPDPSDFGFAAGETFEGILPGDHTTCMLTHTDSAGGSYDAWTFSSLDGYRFNG